MSHDSGFRRGGKDFTHRQNRKAVPRGRTSRQFEQRMKQRFRDQERKAAQAPTAEDETPDG